ncbi:hypothetical protein [Streptomyces sp. CB00072]|uniref:hypothetical protein n=1 Tax=Streptomyces sp. CB00072 TaxID=1703928 RepID=UPI001F516868|nr:hypothetical protein [Streptomyces sp. CB00072]
MWWQRWRSRVDRATAVWAVAYAGFGLVCVLWGTPLFHMGGAPASPALSWAVVGVGMLAAAASGAVTRYGRLPAVRVLLRVACVLAGCAAFGLLMDVITLMFGQGVDSVPVAATVAPAPSAATRSVQLAACAGTVAFLPYVAMKLVWVSGGTFAGVSGASEPVTPRGRGGCGSRTSGWRRSARIRRDMR